MMGTCVAVAVVLASGMVFRCLSVARPYKGQTHASPRLEASDFDRTSTLLT